MERLTPAAFADRIGVNKSSISRAIAAGRITLGPDGLLDPVGARAQFEANRIRRRRRIAPAEADPPASVAAGSAYFDAKTRREQAEAEMAELKAAELRGELVRRAVVERELSGRLVALRESLEVLADRLSALVAAESDQAACRRLIRDEHRKALAGFVESMNAAPAQSTEEAP